MIDDGGLGTPQPAFEADQHKSAAVQFQNGNISLPGLWTYYYGIGGNVDQLGWMPICTS